MVMRLVGADDKTGKLPDAVLNYLDGRYVTQVPRPTGMVNVDTLNLQTALRKAQESGGTAQLQEGTYRIQNVSTLQSPKQPRIIGKGERLTIIEGTTTGSAIMLKGGSGSFSGGYLSDITFTGTGTGLELQGACSINWDRLTFSQSLSLGILFHNRDAGEFTEYCAGRANFFSKTGIEYRRGDGEESFHGSGLTGQSTINQADGATTPSILLGPGVIVYNAPMDVTVWIRSSTQPAIVDNSSRYNSLHGTIRTELFVSGATLVGGSNPYRLVLVGNVMNLGGNPGGFKLGRLALADRVDTTNNFEVFRKPESKKAKLGPAKTVVSDYDGGGGVLYHVTLIGPNYTYMYLLFAQQNPFNASGTVTALANPFSMNDAGWGAPTFSHENYRLNIVNANYPAATVDCVVTATQLSSGGLF
jgi:hypothetical protein